MRQKSYGRQDIDAWNVRNGYVPSKAGAPQQDERLLQVEEAVAKNLPTFSIVCFALQEMESKEHASGSEQNVCCNYLYKI